MLYSLHFISGKDGPGQGHGTARSGPRHGQVRARHGQVRATSRPGQGHGQVRATARPGQGHGREHRLLII